MTAQPPELLTAGDLVQHRESRDADAVSAAVAAVRSYCRWHVAPSVTETRRVEGTGAALLLPTLHLTDVAGVVDLDGSPLTIDGLDWRENGIVVSSARGVYDVTFTHGHDEWPVEVKRVILALASRTRMGAAKSSGAGPFSVSLDAAADDFSSAERAVLDRYRVTRGA